jgi:AcrR family transcriptional regulator
VVSGRRKSFDEDQALGSAMEVFWAKGYVGASLSDLTKSMGINKPSMYSTFGNKEALFIKATEYYIEHNAKSHLNLLFESGVSFNNRVKNYLMSIVRAQCASEKPKGCYLALCQAEIIGGEIPSEACRILTNADKAAQNILIEVLSSDLDAKALKLDNNAVQNALYLTTMLKGTAAMARAGVSLTELEYVIIRSLIGLSIL